MSYVASLLRARGITQKELSEKMGLSKQAVSVWCRSDVIPRKDSDVQKLADILGVTKESLYTRSDNSAHPAAIGYVDIPYLNLSASCGDGHCVDEYPLIQKVRIHKDWLNRKAPAANQSMLNIILADGDSMSPTIESGDMLLVDTSAREIRADAIYAINLDGLLYVKRMQKVPGGVRILSDNTKYPALDVSGDIPVKIIGRVYCIGHFTTV